MSFGDDVESVLETFLSRSVPADDEAVGLRVLRLDLACQSEHGHQGETQGEGRALGDGAGGWLLVIGTALVCAGVTWADRIIEGLAP